MILFNGTLVSSHKTFGLLFVKNIKFLPYMMHTFSILILANLKSACPFKKTQSVHCWLLSWKMLSLTNVTRRTSEYLKMHLSLGGVEIVPNAWIMESIS